MGFKHVVYGLCSMTEAIIGLAPRQRENIRYAPLDEADLSKDEIRELSRRWDLPTWSKPSFACLSSRIPYGQLVTLRS